MTLFITWSDTNILCHYWRPTVIHIGVELERIRCSCFIKLYPCVPKRCGVCECTDVEKRWRPSGVHMWERLQRRGGLFSHHPLYLNCSQSIIINMEERGNSQSHKRESVYYQDVSSVVSRLSGQTDSQPLVIAVCFTCLPAVAYVCTNTFTLFHICNLSR